MAPLESNDKKLGIRPLMAIASFIGMVKYVETHINPSPDVMYVYVAFIAILLGLSTTQNIAEKVINGKNAPAPAQNPAPDGR